MLFVFLLKRSHVASILGQQQPCSQFVKPPQKKAKAHFSYSYLIGPRRIHICRVSSISWLFLGVDLQDDASFVGMIVF